jgi:hypothetical protein
MQYTVVSILANWDEIDEKLKELTQKVNQLLNQGWELAGGISSSNPGASTYCYYQALIMK